MSRGNRFAHTRDARLHPIMAPQAIEFQPFLVALFWTVLLVDLSFLELADSIDCHSALWWYSRASPPLLTSHTVGAMPFVYHTHTACIAALSLHNTAVLPHHDLTSPQAQRAEMRGETKFSMVICRIALHRSSEPPRF